MVGRTTRCRRWEVSRGVSVIDTDIQRRVEGVIDDALWAIAQANGPLDDERST